LVSRFRARVALNSARGSRSGNFAALDGAKARAGQKISALRYFPAPAREACRLSHAINRWLICPRESFGALLEML
jgi:hypothetical protein